MTETILHRGFVVTNNPLKSESFTRKSLEEFGAIVRDLSALNKNDNQCFFGYLAELADSHDMLNIASTFRELAGEQMFVFDWLEDRTTDFLNSAFRDLAMTGDFKVPKSHMNYLLAQLGQPIIPQSKVGIGHLRPYGGQAVDNARVVKGPRLKT